LSRGYWTGFIMGGLVGIVAAKAYGDRLLEAVFPGMVENEDSFMAEEDNNTYRPGRRRRRYLRRT